MQLGVGTVGDGGARMAAGRSLPISATFSAVCPTGQKVYPRLASQDSGVINALHLEALRRGALLAVKAKLRPHTKEGYIMATYLRFDTTPISGNLTLIAGNILPFKVSGLGPDRRPLRIVSSSPAVTVTVVSAKENNFEQSLKLYAKMVTGSTPAELHAYAKNGTEDTSTPCIKVTVEPRLELPKEATDAGALARVLMVENVTPGQRTFDPDEELTTMQWMRWVFINQLDFGTKFGPKYFGTGKDADVTALIKANRRVQGFEEYPKIASDQRALLLEIIRIANDASDNRCELYRQYMKNAIGVAQANKAGIGGDPCPTGLYGWVTTRTPSPGNHYVLFKRQGGQDFYTLTDEFKKDPSLRDKKK